MRKLPNFSDELESLEIPGGDDVDEEVVSRYLLPLVRVWILGDMLFMPQLQNAAMDQIMSIILGFKLPLDVAIAGYGGAPKGSQLSELLLWVVRYAYFGALEGGLGCPTEWSNDSEFEELAKIPGFLADCLTPLAKRYAPIMETVCDEMYKGESDDTKERFMVPE